MDRLSALLGGEAAALIGQHGASVTEVRLRANRPVQVSWIGGSALTGAPLGADALNGVVSALMDYSFYAREAELAQGFFTMADGSRVGVCGRFVRDGGGMRMTDVGSACVRVARPIPGCGDALVGLIDAPEGLRSTLILSPPGLGKTTLLRDIARQLSLSGRCVGLVDERHELAACHMGVPTLDVGPRTDVMDGCPRDEAVSRLIRAMAPAVIVADEIGGAGDAAALLDAARCGVAVVASAHGEHIDATLERPWLRSAVVNGAVRWIVLLGGRPGNIREVRDLGSGGGDAWKSA